MTSIMSVYIEHFLSQGHYTGRALRDVGPFLRYMESEFNVKVNVGEIMAEMMCKHSLLLSDIYCWCFAFL